MKTRIVRGLAATAALLLIICMGVTAVSAQSVSVNPTTTTDLCPDDQFTITVEVDSGADDLRAVSLDLTYDSTMFEVVSDTVEDDLFGAGNYLDIGTGDDGAGTINVQIARKGTVHEPESGTLLTVVFEVKAGAPEAVYDLGLQNVVLKDENNDAIPGVAETDGTAEVDCGGTTPVPTVKVSPETTTNLCPGTNDDFTVTVEVDSDTYDLRAVSLDLTYDSTVFEVVSDTIEDDLFGAGNYLDIGTGDDGAGTINVQIARKGTVHEPESGTLLTVVFEVKAGAPEAVYDLGLQNVVLKDENNDAIPGVAETDGTAEIDCNDPPTVTVTDPTSGTVSGTIDVTATATDTDGTVTQVAFYLMPAGTLIGTDTNAAGGWSCPLDTTTAADGTGYQIKAVATDNEGATGDDTGGVFEIDNSCPCDFCLDLEAGLNFVSIPKTLVDSPKNATTVFDVDYYTGEFCLYYDASAGSFDLDADVKPCRGFLVYKNSAKSVCVDFDDTAPAPSQQLYEGWNMIGHIKPVAMPINDGTTADFVSITGLEEPEGNELFRLMATYTGTGWSEYPSGSLTDVTPGAGYWIYMNQDVVMSGGFE